MPANFPTAEQKRYYGRSAHAAASRRYFGRQRGITWYHWMIDQQMDIHGIAVTSTLKDAPYLLDGLLEQETHHRPAELITDTGGYSDIVFGFFRLLGYRFSPRLADLGDARFWRMNLLSWVDDVAYRRRVSTQLTRIEGRHRLAGALRFGRKGKLYEQYREGQEDELNTLGLVTTRPISSDLLCQRYRKFPDACTPHPGLEYGPAFTS